MQIEPRSFAAALLRAALLAWLALAASPASAADARLSVEDAWIRWLPANLPAAGYVRITNAGDSPVTLVGAASPAYAHVSLHRSVTAGGRMQMTPIDRIRIAAHSSLDFEAGGYHLMLMDATQSLEHAGRVPITLHFADGSSLLVQFEVRKPDAG
jgi:copper(I)-binding protein